MTEAQAQNFVSKCGRWWLGHKTFDLFAIVLRTRANCIALLVQAVGSAFVASMGHWHTAQKLLFGASLIEFLIVVGIMIRLHQATKVLCKHIRL